MKDRIIHFLVSVALRFRHVQPGSVAVPDFHVGIHADASLIAILDAGRIR